MIRMRFFTLFWMISALVACKSARQLPYQVNQAGEVKATTASTAFLEQLLKEDELLRDILDHRDEYKIQIIYTQINRDANQQPHFTDYYLNLNPASYFYPASAVKMPAAFMALEKIAGMPGVDLQTTMITGADRPGQTPVYNDPLSADGRPTLAGYIRKIFLVSDNDAFNRIYEFLGQQYLNDGMRAKGYKETELIHRLQITLPDQENRATNPIRFLDAQGKLIMDQPGQVNTQPHFQRHDALGTGYVRGGQRFQEPMDFSSKNRIALSSLHQSLRAIIFPQAVAPHQRFHIREEDRQWLLKTMGEFPTESQFPPYPGADTAGNKILFYGDGKQDPIQPGLRIFNKTGGAYGFLLDVAYVADFTHHVEFMLSAVIYCNADGILNDDKYDYHTIGYPFMRALGRKIYAYELSRPKTQQADLSEFRFNW